MFSLFTTYVVCFICLMFHIYVYIFYAQVYPDNEVEASKARGSQSDERMKLNLDSSELMKALDTSRDEMINNKQLVSAEPLSPVTKERNCSSTEPWETSDEENEMLVNDLVMLSVEDSTK